MGISNTKYTFFHILINDPLVCVISSGILFASGVSHAINFANGKKCLILVQLAWYAEAHIGEFCNTTSQVKRVASNVSFVFICPTLAEADLLRSVGLVSYHIHKNAFIDEKIFKPIGCKKRYSAVHIANVEMFKRHYLAWGVNNIAVISYSYQQDVDMSELSGYKNLGYSNFSLTGDAPEMGSELSPPEVALIINQSKCGLILSECEGANNASTEYLLCGIPVISTPSKGGRDEFFTKSNSMIVHPEEHNVQNAVEYFGDFDVNSNSIREEVLSKIMLHRKRLLLLLSAYSGNDFFINADENFWHPMFTNKLRNAVPLG